MRSLAQSVLVLLVAVLTAALLPALAVRAAVSQPRLVSAIPAAQTPDVNDGRVYALAKVDRRIIAGGSFTNVTPHGSTTPVARTGALSFSSVTGNVTPGFAPKLDGTVLSAIAGPSPDTVYLGGNFSTVNGVKAHGLTLLDTGTGQIVPGFSTPAMDGAIYSMALRGGRLFIAGSFTSVGGQSRQGIAALNPTTGAVSSYITVSFTEHHNYNGSGAVGAVGPRSIAITPDGTKMVVIGNFKKANGVVHDQIAMIDLGASSGTLDTGWNTLAYTAACGSGAFDTYMRAVDISPDGKYFVIAANGGSGTNTDGSKGLCDAVARFEVTSSGPTVAPTWVDWTGDDSMLSVAATGTTIYAGGHQRWVNNPDGADAAGAGSVPRPGIVALDPSNGLPYKWNPGRNPRGAGAYALLATDAGLYVGSDTEWIGSYKYHRKRIAYFPLDGGAGVTAPTTPHLPANLFLGNPVGATDQLRSSPYNGSTVGTTTTLANTGVAWSRVRGAFLVSTTMFYGATSGGFYRRLFTGKTFGASSAIDPYDDPTWSNVGTGITGQTYRGRAPTFFAELPKVTGMFYTAGRLYYTVQGEKPLFYRYFTPNSGVVGEQEFQVDSGDFSAVSSITFVDGKIYWVESNGLLHRDAFVNGAPDFSTDQTISGPSKDGKDWRGTVLFSRSQ